jgi:hypothetical protein
MSLAGEMGLDAERLSRRTTFLLDRAGAHLEQSGPRRLLHVACAGNLLRDAAASALLLDDSAMARKLLVQAGEHWADIGVFAGYALLAMGSPQAWWTDRRHKLETVFEELTRATRSTSERPPERRADREPMLEGSVGSTRQLLNLYQSIRPHSDRDSFAAEVSAVARERLLEATTAQVGATEVPLKAYLHLFDAAVHGDVDGAARDTLHGLVLRRVELLNAARADEYHWRMGLAPAALVDFDILALMIASMDARETVAEFEEPFAGRDNAIRAPMIAARALRP